MTEKDIANNEKVNKAIENVNSNKNLIVVGNNIISARHGMTSFQLKLLHFLFLNMKNTDYQQDSFIEITVNVLDFHKVLGTATSDYLYNKVYIEMEKLRKTDIFVETDVKWEKASIISQTSYNKHEGSFSFVLPPLLQRYLLNLKRNFTYIDIRNIVNLDSSYSIRFFDLCKQYERFDKFQLKIDDIRTMFDLPQAYSLYANIKNKIIKKAYEELKELSDLYFEYEEVKKNKKVDSVIFYIKKKPQRKTLAIEEVVLPLETTSTSIKLANLSIPESTAQKWIVEFGNEKVDLAIDYLYKQIKKGTVIPNIPGYIYTMISTDHLTKSAEKIIEKQHLAKKDNESKKTEKLKEQIQTQQLEEIENYYYNRRLEVIEQCLIGDDNLINLILDDLNKDMIGNIAFENYKKKVGAEHKNQAVFLEYLENDKGSFYVSTINFLTEKKEIEELVQLKEAYQKDLQKIGVNQ